MNMYQVRALFVRNYRRDRNVYIFYVPAAKCNSHATELFNARWPELSYYERVLTARRLLRPGVHCVCLPTCIKL